MRSGVSIGFKMHLRNGLVMIRTILQKRWSEIFLAALCCLTGYQCASGGTPSPELPDSVYFLDGDGGESQIWKLDLDSQEAIQITDEESGIYDFAVSQPEGTIAYISHQKLFLWEPDREYSRLLVDPSLVDPPPGYDYPAGVAYPVFSPDGSVLAYELHGVHFYHLESGRDQLVLSSPGNLLGETFVFTKERPTLLPVQLVGRQPVYTLCESLLYSESSWVMDL
jgi:hypothetical protein